VAAAQTKKKERRFYPSLFQDRHRPGVAYPVLFIWRMLTPSFFEIEIDRSVYFL
jgi:hypothetical protein